jgi:hypothetical protein
MGGLLKGIFLPGLMARVCSRIITIGMGITDEIELKSSKLLEICRTSFNHVPSRVGQVVPRSPTRGLSRAKEVDVEESIQRFPQGRRVSLSAQLVDKLEDTPDVVVDLENLHR